MIENIDHARLVSDYQGPLMLIEELHNPKDAGSPIISRTNLTQLSHELGRPFDFLAATRIHQDAFDFRDGNLYDIFFRVYNHQPVDADIRPQAIKDIHMMLQSNKSDLGLDMVPYYPPVQYVNESLAIFTDEDGTTGTLGITITPERYTCVRMSEAGNEWLLLSGTTRKQASDIEKDLESKGLRFREGFAFDQRMSSITDTLFPVMLPPDALEIVGIYIQADKFDSYKELSQH